MELKKLAEVIEINGVKITPIEELLKSQLRRIVDFPKVRPIKSSMNC